MSNAVSEAGARSHAYLAMAQIFSYPTPPAWQRLTDYGLVDPAISAQDLEAEYLAAFEVGRDTAAVPLFEGMHRGDIARDGILEDLLRFYEFFDVKLSESDREYPDHLVTELEFVAWLCLQEQAVGQRGGDTEFFRRAERDFLARHLSAWLPVFRKRLAATNTHYVQYGETLAELVQTHRTQLSHALQETGETP